MHWMMVSQSSNDGCFLLSRNLASKKSGGGGGGGSRDDGGIMIMVMRLMMMSVSIYACLLMYDG